MAIDSHCQHFVLSLYTQNTKHSMAGPHLSGGLFVGYLFLGLDVSRFKPWGHPTPVILKYQEEEVVLADLDDQCGPMTLQSSAINILKPTPRLVMIQAVWKLNLSNSSILGKLFLWQPSQKFHWSDQLAGEDPAQPDPTRHKNSLAELGRWDQLGVKAQQQPRYMPQSMSHQELQLMP